MAENGQKKLFEGSVNITIYDIPAGLLHEFGKRVIEPFYKGGISEAIRDLMLKKVEERKHSSVFDAFPWKKDESLLEKVDKLMRRREYEDYTIFKFGSDLAFTEDIDLVFREKYPDGFLVRRIGDEFEALNVEFEEFSSTFKEHGHDPKECDLIICKQHDWKQEYPNEKCPLAVYEVGSYEKQGTFYPKEAC